MKFGVQSESHCAAWNSGRFFSSHFPQVIDHYENPRNVGALDKSLQSVGTGVVGAPACGDVMKLQVCPFCLRSDPYQILVDEQGRITEAKFKTYGCGSAIASSSLVTEMVLGKTVRVEFLVIAPVLY